MSTVVIEKPVINSPYREPDRHFKFNEEGITDEIEAGRRKSAYFIPIARPRNRRAGQMAFDTEWTQERIQENENINKIRDQVSQWRKGGYGGITPVSRTLLEYWQNTEREKKFFFCQIEALETAIFIAEVDRKYNNGWIENTLIDANNMANPGLPRVAFKMATGSGKTVVMGMLIAWQTLNKFASPQDTRFTDTFLIITPGITIRDRLRVLLPNDPQNYYRERDILPPDLLENLCQAKILITNFHAFGLREKVKTGKLTREILSSSESGAFTETFDQMVRRVCREFGGKKKIMVINDEAHHCYRRKPDAEENGLKGDEREEAKKREEEARVWITGIEAVKSKIGIKTIYDLSATPFFLRGSGYQEGTLFPWVVSDFSLIDCIEAGIVKVPRVPVADDAMNGEQPTYRDLWLRIREDLPKKGRKTDEVTGEPILPLTLQGALHSLYSNYEKYYKLWKDSAEAQEKGITPPVFIVVCNNTNVSKLVYEFISGWEKQINEKIVAQAGKLDIFRNDDGQGGWLMRPNTILVDSQQLESGEAMSADFKQIAAREIDEFKNEYRQRFPGRDAGALKDEDILREVMNTVGKPGKLGEQIKCVVSVSMLTEGWDANTVTHVLGVRAFGTQLLCEQVVGRGLRRRSYAANEQGMLEPEYAEVYGVPFSFIPCSGSTKEPKPGPMPTRVRALEERIYCEIFFPRLTGYRYDLGGERLTAKFSQESKIALTAADLPMIVENAPIVGESSIHTLDDLMRHRPNEVAFLLARYTLETYFRDDEENLKPWLFPQLLAISKQWMVECLVLKDNTFPQLLLLMQFASQAASRIYTAIIASAEGQPRLKPILRPYDRLGSTRYVDFDTLKPVYATRADKCHISHVVADTTSWEQKLAQSLEDMDEVARYVKNQNLGFTIPYILNGEQKNYIPDFIVCIQDGHGQEDLLNLIIEVTGERTAEKQAKVSTAKTLWIPAVNAHGGFGRWEFVEIQDPYDAKNLIRGHIKAMHQVREEN